MMPLLLLTRMLLFRGLDIDMEPRGCWKYKVSIIEQMLFFLMLLIDVLMLLILLIIKIIYVLICYECRGIPV